MTLTVSAVSPARIRRLARNISAWFDRSPRDLPWRRTCDPYHVWIAEIMLQQTQVDTVVPYFNRFLMRFPDIRSLAEAKEDDVLLLWSGLGYYSRARNLLRAARAVAVSHGGMVPRAPEVLQSLPGIGRYTAGAVASIAYNDPAPIVDGNVARVLSRLFALDDTPESREGKRNLWELAALLVREAPPRLLNQGLMELGALVCTPKSPRCSECPVKRSCLAKREGDPARYPVAGVKKKTLAAAETFAVILRKDSLLLGKRSLRVHYAGMWDLPRASATGTGVQSLERIFHESCGLSLSLNGVLGRLEYGIMNRRVRATFRNAVLHGLPEPGGVYCEFRWIRFRDLDGHAIPAPVRRFLNSHFHPGRRREK